MLKILFIWDSNLAGQPIFYLANLALEYIGIHITILIPAYQPCVAEIIIH